MEVRVAPPGRFGDWHVGPQRQYIINLAGSGQLEVAEGKVDLPPGSIEYIDDLTGKGHTTRTTSTEDRVSIWLKFEDQKQRIGPLNLQAKASPKPYETVANSRFWVLSSAPVGLPLSRILPMK